MVDFPTNSAEMVGVALPPLTDYRPHPSSTMAEKDKRPEVTPSLTEGEGERALEEEGGSELMDAVAPDDSSPVEESSG